MKKKCIYYFSNKYNLLFSSSLQPTILIKHDGISITFILTVRY